MATLPNFQASDGDFAELIETEGYVPSYPFLENDEPTTGPKIHERVFEVARESYAPTLHDRVVSANGLLWTTDLSQAAWQKLTSGTGVAAVVSAGFSGPAGGAAWRVQLDRGAGSTSSDYSFFGQGLSGLVNPHFAYASLWLKSNTGSPQNVGLYLGLGLLAPVVQVTNEWQRFTLSGLVSSTIDSVYVFVRGGSATDTQVDILVACPQWSLVAGEAFVPTDGTARSVSHPPLDREDLFAFQVGEAKPQLLDGGLLRVTKTYARLPAGVIYSPASDGATFARPNIHGIKSGSYYAISFDQRRAWIYATRKTVTATASITASSSTRTGTITRTGTNPTATGARSVGSLPVNWGVDITGPTAGTSSIGSASGIAAIASAMTSRGYTNVAVSKDAYQVAISFTSAAGTFSVTTGAVRISGGAQSGSVTISAAETQAAGTDTQTVSESESQNITETFSVDGSVRRFTISAPSVGQVGDHVAFMQGDKVIALSKCVAAPTTTTFDVPLGDVGGKDFAPDTCVFSSQSLWCIAIEPPVTGATARLAQRFYLPGYSAGITNRADVPAFQAETNPVTWLGKVVAYLAAPSEDTYFIVAAGAVAQWPAAGPMLMRPVTEVQMQDVVVQVSADA